MINNYIINNLRYIIIILVIVMTISFFIKNLYSEKIVIDNIKTKIYDEVPIKIKTKKEREEEEKIKEIKKKRKEEKIEREKEIKRREQNKQIEITTLINPIPDILLNGPINTGSQKN